MQTMTVEGSDFSKTSASRKMNFQLERTLNELKRLGKQIVNINTLPPEKFLGLWTYKAIIMYM